MRTHIAVALACLLGFGGPTMAQDFVSGDWNLGCDERPYCIARTNDGAGMQLKIERGPDTGGSVFVSVRIPSETPLEEGMRVDIDVLGIGHSESKEIDRVYSGNEMTFGGDADRALINALREGNRGQVTVKFGGDTGTRVYDVSLRGVTSALAEMDRLQGRDDRVDAIVLRGGQSAGSGEPQPPAKPAEPVVEAAPEENFAPAVFAEIVYAESDVPDEVLMTGYRVFECDFPFVLDGYGAQVVGVTEFLELWMVPCNPADVNVDFYISLHAEGMTDFYEFKEGPFNDNSVGLVTNPRWNNERRQLTTWSVYGPDSDCGNFATYQYVTEDDAFDLIAYREKPECDGVPTLPEDYPLVWTAG